ncbi:MAG: hypothetical protein PVH11_07425 [Anaerolineae bacterium]|jgi:hypothetical protein
MFEGKRSHKLSFLGGLVVLMAWLMAPVLDAIGSSAPLIGEPFPIAAESPSYEWFPSVAQDTQRKRFLVVYQDEGGITAVCLSGLGAPLRSYPVSASGDYPDVVYNAWHDQYLIVWQQYGTIRGARLQAECLAGGLSASFDISSDRPGTEGRPAVAYNHHENHQDYLVVWSDQSTFTGVWARRLSATSIDANSFPVAEGTAFYSNSDPDVAYNLNHNEYLVVYVHDPGGADNKDIYGRRVYNANGGGLLAEHPIDSSGKDQRDPAVAAYRLNQANPYVVVFQDYWNDTVGDVRGYLCNVDGEPVNLLNIATVSGRQEMMPAIASSEPLGYTVVWQQSDGGFDIFGRRVSETGVMPPTFEVSLGSRLFPVGHDEAMPAVAGGSPSALVVWHETAQGQDANVFGRLLGYRVYLPLTVRQAG